MDKCVTQTSKRWDIIIHICPYPLSIVRIWEIPCRLHRYSVHI